MGGQSHLFLLHTSSRAAVVQRILAAPCTLCNPIKRYSEGSNEGGEDFLRLAKTKDVQATDQEKAPSLEDEFERVAEEKSKAREEVKGAEQGVASQTTEKVYDGAEEATIVDPSKVESA
ncbi:hypothetical protein SLEP1_g46629 [Rubroshorea leprosula]|uniref:Uncharacterized protein n=1 Tax=Rubroshorea leprosula TaxID=152421 RepID=A0AAV5LMV8_9ROSI|nr:hypothetical protein SLEP1_g46629 [Rubroshorea leprosula]